jgi:hypothetical protein
MAKQPDPTKQIINGLDELEAAAELMEEKAIQMKIICRKAKATMGEVSTSPIKKDLEKVVADALAKSAARRKRA